MEKITKKRIIKTTLVAVGVAVVGWVLSKNRKQSGVIKNQKLMIEGLTKEVKNLSYQLGKKTNIINNIIKNSKT